MKRIKMLFFSETLRHWYFKDVIEASGLSRERVNHYLKMLLREDFIKRIKPRGKMPYYVANKDSTRFRYEKRFFGLNMLKSLFEHLNSLREVKTAILFGSFARGNWTKSSDIDLFVFGNLKDFEKGKIESSIGREIQLFYYSDTKKLKKELEPKLIKNIVNGFNIKGSIKPFEVIINA